MFLCCDVTQFGNARHTANGVDFNRLLFTIAVLTQRISLRLGEQDVSVNIIGGLKIGEPTADLAVAAAIASPMQDQLVNAPRARLAEPKPEPAAAG